ncbi:hypothetical protein IPH25_01980 [bacterium]|nr:MAG: hypothetical protein IPG37_04110 [bacterium]QQR62193.1 MAG: hypothetical protein IPH25_01980 [bacterium]QQR63249.1 MAG: hypothetical protein IPH67_02120 [bacterium]
MFSQSFTKLLLSVQSIFIPNPSEVMVPTTATTEYKKEYNNVQTPTFEIRIDSQEKSLKDTTTTRSDNYLAKAKKDGRKDYLLSAIRYEQTFAILKNELNDKRYPSIFYFETPVTKHIKAQLLAIEQLVTNSVNDSFENDAENVKFIKKEVRHCEKTIQSYNPNEFIEKTRPQLNTIINIFKAAHINIDIPQDTTIIWNYQIFTEQLLRIYILLGLVENKNKGSINNREDMFITQMYQDDKYDLFKEKIWENSGLLYRNIFSTEMYNLFESIAKKRCDLNQVINWYQNNHTDVIVFIKQKADGIKIKKDSILLEKTLATHKAHTFVPIIFTKDIENNDNLTVSDILERHSNQYTATTILAAFCSLLDISIQAKHEDTGFFKQLSSFDHKASESNEYKICCKTNNIKIMNLGMENIRIFKRYNA